MSGVEARSECCGHGQKNNLGEERGPRTPNGVLCLQWEEATHPRVG